MFVLIPPGAVVFSSDGRDPAGGLCGGEDYLLQKYA